MDGEIMKLSPPPYRRLPENSPNPEPQIMPAAAPMVYQAPVHLPVSPPPPISPPPQSVNNIVIRTANDPLATTHFGPKPQLANCPYCHIQSKTTIKVKALKKAHYWTLALCLTGLWCFVCCPYKCCNCSQILHNCGNCGAYLDTYDP